MQRICLLNNTIQPYAWGSHTAIPELLGIPPDPATPQAELWMGAHPKAPSMISIDGRLESLKDLIDDDPETLLGRQVAERYKNELPFLFKVLAAAEPLSLQAHPSIDQALEGFNRENVLGIAMDSPQRNYRDPNHKPECICALTPFWALHGFRRIFDIISLADRLRLEPLAPLVRCLQERPDHNGLKTFFKNLMTLPQEQTKSLATQAADAARERSEEEDAFRWIVTLSASYPEDIGILAPLYLNLVLLQPGEALYLPAAELHAYLEGVGIELMANSDNVLRGGLTSKHIDVEELLAVLHFEERMPMVLKRRPGARGDIIYDCPADEFVLSVISVNEHSNYSSPEHRSIEILLCTTGMGKIIDRGSGDVTPFKKGDAVLIPAAVAAYDMEGNAAVYKAAVPL